MLPIKVLHVIAAHREKKLRPVGVRHPHVGHRKQPGLIVLVAGRLDLVFEKTNTGGKGKWAARRRGGEGGGRRGDGEGGGGVREEEGRGWEEGSGGRGWEEGRGESTRTNSKKTQVLNQGAGFLFGTGCVFHKLQS